MSERLAQGPLDTVREIGVQAEELDWLARTVRPNDSEAFSSLQAQAKELEAEHPLLKQEVVVYGTAVHADFNRVVRRWRRAKAPEHVTQTGKYGGIMVCETYDSDTGQPDYRVVHVIHLGSSPMVSDGLGNFDQKHYMNYVLAKGSEVVPILPVNAHSLEELEDDPVIELIDKIMYDEAADDTEKIIRLGEEVNEALAAHEFHEDPSINHQRASYINALGLHGMVSLKVSEILIGDADEAATEFEFAVLDSAIKFMPDIFEIASGYELVSGQEEPLTGGPPELYARASLPQEPKKILLTALKRILDVETLSLS